MLIKHTYRRFAIAGFEDFEVFTKRCLLDASKFWS